MILSGISIKDNIALGNISIFPFDEKKINPNSYNLTLNKELIVYDEDILDMKKDNIHHKLIIPKEGLVIRPGKLYLGRTNEYTKTINGLVPMLDGRSSIGRLGIAVHATAGFGDVGFEGFWTLEISCIQPVRIYPDAEICQIYYHQIYGDYIPYGIKSKYNRNDGIQTSKMFLDFKKE